MAGPVLTQPLEMAYRPSVAEQVFEELRRQRLSLELTPRTKRSEVEVAKAIGVSRQPVRNAFYRLPKLGFLLIRPQCATTAALISSAAVKQARFIRTAIEPETVRAHLNRILQQIERIRAANHDWFADAEV